MKPGVSSSTISGNPKLLHVSMNQEPFSEVAESRTPARYRGWLATIPTGLPPSRARPTKRLRAQRGPELEQRALIDDRRCHGADVVDVTLRRRDDGPWVNARLAGELGCRRRLVAVGREVGEDGADQPCCFVLVRGDQRRNAVARMNLRPAQLLLFDLLGENLLDDLRAGQEHARLTTHDHEVVERRRIAASPCGGPIDHRDLRDPPGASDVLGEDPTVTLQGRRALVHTCSPRMNQTDCGNSRLPRHLEDPHDRICVGRTERAPEECRLLRVDECGPPTDQDAAGEDSIAGQGAPGSVRGDGRPDWSERAPVADRSRSDAGRSTRMQCMQGGGRSSGRGARRHWAPSMQSTAL